MNAALLKSLISARKLAQFVWSRACDFDGMPADTKFASFSASNPFVGPANAAASHVQQIMAKLTDIANARPLSPFDMWMVKQNLGYVRTEGLDTVLSRLRQQGYNKVANAVEREARAGR